MAVAAALQLDATSLRSDLELFASKNVADQLGRHGDALKEIEAAKNQANETLEAIKKAAGQVGVSKHAEVFAKQAEEHLMASRLWIALTYATLFATIGWGFIAIRYFSLSANASAALIAQEIVTRLIVFSGLSYALVWCARNYSANRHNYVLNKHRQNSLMTFEAFAKAAEGDAETKNAILVQATTSIFSAQKTGYSPKEPDLDRPSQILEIVRSVKSGG